MGARLRSWWQQIRKHPVASVLIALFFTLVVLVILGGYKFNWGWTGFNQPSRTLWDWLQLLGVLGVPVVVGLGAVWFTTRQGKVADAENKDNQRETALQAYIDKMSELLLEKHLRESQPEDEVRNIARVRTLTLLRGLDPIRKGGVLQFLYESGLIEKAKPIIDLRRADLSNTYIVVANLHGANLCETNLSQSKLRFCDLRGVNLRGANLRRAILREANISEADLFASTLSGVDLANANLSGANLEGAFMFEANLRGAKVTAEQLDQASSLKGATMPDGSKHP